MKKTDDAARMFDIAGSNIRRLKHKPGDPQFQYSLHIADGLTELAGAVGDTYDMLAKMHDTLKKLL